MSTLEILILSDTHGPPDSAILFHMNEVDEIWHAGDLGDEFWRNQKATSKKFRGVRGNIDDPVLYSDWPEDHIFIVNGVKVFITHIGGTVGKMNARIKKIIKSEAPSLFVCGHSHILKVMFDKNNDMLFINPGAAGRHGFHLKRTMIRLKVSEGKLSDLRVIELGNR
jgi:putative phosphoesterase